MAIEQLTIDEARVAGLAALGFSDDRSLESSECLATALRRAASFLCPTSPRHLVDAVRQTLAPLADAPESLGERLGDLTEALIASGDLVEAEADEEGPRRRTLYLGYPRFIPRPDGRHVLIGIRPEGAQLVGEDVMTHVVCEAHLRRLADNVIGAADLEASGMRPVSVEHWLRSPEIMQATEYVASFDDELATQSPSGELVGLRLIDPTKPPRYYNGRWRALERLDTGRFVARRSQAYGAELWCYVEIADGAPLRFVDLPLGHHHSSDRGCDEAWRLQCALDAIRGDPQLAHIEGTGHGALIIGMTIPPPAWLQRRWDLFGRPTRQKGSLFAYEFPAGDLAAELEFAEKRLWLGRSIHERSLDEH